MVHLTNASDDDDDDFVLEDSKSTPVTEAGADDEPHGQKRVRGAAAEAATSASKEEAA